MKLCPQPQVLWALGLSIENPAFCRLSAGPALVFFEGCTIKGGVLRLPGGTKIPLPDGIDTVDDILATRQRQRLVWGGAVHIVNVANKAGKATRRTGAEHRKYHLHLLCSATASAPAPPRRHDYSGRVSLHARLASAGCVVSAPVNRIPPP